MRNGARAMICGAVMVGAASGGLSDLKVKAEPPEPANIVRTQCAACHRLAGPAVSRYDKQAPDLIGIGSKFKHEWLVGWLEGKEDPVYALGYRWDEIAGPTRHVVLPKEQAEAVADYLEVEFVDPKVKAGAIDMSTFSKQEAAFGEKIFKEHACIGCHLIREGGKNIGGAQSASLAEAGKRLKADWIYRFNSNPPDYVPHSGEFVGDVSELGLRYVTGFIATRGWEEFPYYEPWKSEAFGRPSVARGELIYKEYCAQCHGATGKGDGPAAAGLEPKPAVHANIQFEKVPTEYLYNVINYGGRAVGKSPTMPYWGLTIGQQGVADVMAYLTATFKGPAQVAEAPDDGNGQLGTCPQPRKTAMAPKAFLEKPNPLPSSADAIEAGKALFQHSAQPVACALCHGPQGDGRGVMGAALVPPPRNFTCGSMMKHIPDGQLFWVIKNGSPGTGMMPFAGLPDEQVWQLVHYIRSLAR